MQGVKREMAAKEMASMLVNSNRSEAVRTLQAVGFLQVLFPEVSALVGVEQGNLHQEGDAFEHTCLVLSALQDPSVTLAFAALLHDTGKVETQAAKGEGFSFHKHEEVSVRLAEEAFNRLRLSVAGVEKERLLFLVENHMRVRRLPEMKASKQVALFRSPFFPELLALLKADDMGSLPVRDSHSKVEALYASYLAQGDLSPKVLGLDGGTLMRELNLRPGPLVGQLKRHLDEVLQENPGMDREGLLEEGRKFLSQS